MSDDKRNRWSNIDHGSETRAGKKSRKGGQRTKETRASAPSATDADQKPDGA